MNNIFYMAIRLSLSTQYLYVNNQQKKGADKIYHNVARKRSIYERVYVWTERCK